MPLLAVTSFALLPLVAGAAAPTGGAVARVFDARGARNVWIAELPTDGTLNPRPWSRKSTVNR